MARVALADRSAFAALYDATGAKLFGVTLRICRSRAEAEEVLQTAYERIWRNAASYAGSRASPIAWMAAIARNAAIDRRRAEAARGGMSEPLEAAEVAVDPGPSPEDASELASDTRRLHACLRELDERHAIAVRRAYLGGLTYREIATSLDVPENTIKTWVRRSLTRLRACMNRTPDRDGTARDEGEG